MYSLGVELLRTKFTATYFTGTETDAKEFCDLWKCTYDRDPLKPYLFYIQLPDGGKLYADHYVVMDDGFNVYTENEFAAKFRVFYDSRDRTHITHFMSED